MPYGITQCYLPLVGISVIQDAEGISFTTRLYYRRDAVLARVLAMARCLCLSQVGRSIETDECIELVSRTGVSFQVSTILYCVSEIRVSSKISCFPLELFFKLRT